jgi:hypothetical protein
MGWGRCISCRKRTVTVKLGIVTVTGFVVNSFLCSATTRGSCGLGTPSCAVAAAFSGTEAALGAGRFSCVIGATTDVLRRRGGGSLEDCTRIPQCEITQGLHSSAQRPSVPTDVGLRRRQLWDVPCHCSGYDSDDSCHLRRRVLPVLNVTQISSKHRRVPNSRLSLGL